MSVFHGSSLQPEVELQIPRLPPDFLSSLVGSAKFMRLSSMKAAHVAISGAA
jgi:hypothetical protein